MVRILLHCLLTIYLLINEIEPEVLCNNFSDVLVVIEFVLTLSFLRSVTSTAAIANFGDNAMNEEEEGERGPNSSRTEQLVEDFWTALARTGVQISSTEDALL